MGSKINTSMDNQTYVEECGKLIKTFEYAQQQMLRLNLIIAQEEFSLDIIEMRNYFVQMQRLLEKKNFEVKRDKILLTKQIDRLLKFLKEMERYIQDFKKDPPPDEKEIIFIFDRQHLFKNIFHKHLSDFASLST